MATPDKKDLLAAFSPYLKVNLIWDTLKGQLQTEFANITSPDATGGIQQKLNERGHLSLDYKCMQWVQLWKKKKKSGNLLLVLGTGGGDILALDVAAGILKWKVRDCHPGGASSVSFSRHGSLYTGGVDGMVCKIDPSTGNLLGKFKASTKAISALSVSAGIKSLVSRSLRSTVNTSFFKCRLLNYRFVTEWEVADARIAWNKIDANRFTDYLNKHKAAAKKVTRNFDDPLMWKGHGPPSIRRDYWDTMCDQWATEHFRHYSRIVAENRSKMHEAILHTSGSISFGIELRILRGVIVMFVYHLFY
ncbi:hypothetical protein Taro_029032, partial [Colocasia esculenta]|nr:hypothetical protein [Colocasia esculenta]